MGVNRKESSSGKTSFEPWKGRPADAVLPSENWKPEHYLRETLVGDGQYGQWGLHRTPTTRLLLAVLESADRVIERGPEPHQLDRHARDRAKEYAETISWAFDADRGPFSLGLICEYLRIQGFSLGEEWVRTRWRRIIQDPSSRRRSKASPFRRAGQRLRGSARIMANAARHTATTSRHSCEAYGRASQH